MNMSKNIIILVLFVQFMIFLNVKAQDNPSTQDAVSNFQPSLAVVIGILSIMFSFTFVLLLYAKFCHRPATATVHHNSNLQQIQDGLIRSRSQSSGVDKTVVESLPFFRFSSLKGRREGLECAVCLSRFDDMEILRLLPKCKHAFHIGCIDQWLANHSTCPLCRHRISSEDLSALQFSNSLRFLWNSFNCQDQTLTTLAKAIASGEGGADAGLWPSGPPSNTNQSELREESNLELYIHREEDSNPQSRSSRFSILRSFRKTGNKQTALHKLNHRINIVSDVVLKNRWSNVSSSDLMFLSTGMIHDLASSRFSSLDRNTDHQMATRVIEEEEEVNPNHRGMNLKEEIERKRLFEIKIKQNNDSFPSSSESRIDSNKTLCLDEALTTTSKSIIDNENPTIIPYTCVAANTTYRYQDARLWPSRPPSNTSKALTHDDKRSMSEIVIHPRFRDLNFKNVVGSNGNTRFSDLGENNNKNGKEERRRKAWLPIARRTVEWFANRERRSNHQSPQTRQTLNV